MGIADAEDCVGCEDCVDGWASDAKTGVEPPAAGASFLPGVKVKPAAAGFSLLPDPLAVADVID